MPLYWNTAYILNENGPAALYAVSSHSTRMPGTSNIIFSQFQSIFGSRLQIWAHLGNIMFVHLFYAEGMFTRQGSVSENFRPDCTWKPCGKNTQKLSGHTKISVDFAAVLAMVFGVV